MNISFGKKIPITYCQIFDNEQQKFVGATCFKYDCNDKSDIDEIRQLGDDWRYMPETLANMRRKTIRQNQGLNCDVVVFTLENNNGETLGLCCAEDKERSLEVNYIESKQNNKHKYVGQALLASMGTQLLNDSHKWKFIIRNAIASAYDFYEKTCGFNEDTKNSDLNMNRLETRKFIKQTEKRTKSQIIELEA